MSTNKYDIFISYSRHDTDIVNKIVSILEHEGFKIWIDKNGIESGDAFKHVIVKAIEQSSCVLFFSSIASNNSKWTAKEIGVAVYENKCIIPIIIDNSKYNPEVKFDLINLDYIDFSDIRHWSESQKRLLNTLKSKCNKMVESINTDNTNSGSISNNNISKPSFFHNIINQVRNDNKKRNPFVNLALYIILILGILYTIFGVSQTIWSIRLLDDPEWSFIDIYGKGFIPGLLMSIAISFSNLLSIRWNKNGVYLLCITLFIIFIPTIWNEFEEFIYFSVFSLIGIGVYYILLRIPYKGHSVWKQCLHNSGIMRHICIISLFIWFVILVALPPLFAMGHGFKDNLYSNGMIAIDARCNSNSFYILRLANSMAFNTDNYHTDKWYEKAISKSELEHDNYIELDCYVNYMFYQVKINDGDIFNTISKATDKFGLTEIKNEVLEDHRLYDRAPYRQTLIDILSQPSNF